MANDITFTRPELTSAYPVWQLVRDVCRGQQAIKAKGSDYLPRLDPSNNSPENDARNKSYLERAVFLNATGTTKNGYLGMACRKNPLMNVSDKLSFLKTNADGSGTSIYQQAQNVLENVLEVGRHFLYVDYNDQSKQAQILSYPAENVINWRVDRINGRNQLVLVVLKEIIEVADGYGFKSVTQYRELALEDGKFICKVHRANDEGKFVVDAEYTPNVMAGGAWDEIPCTFVGAQNNDSSIDESPLLDLANMNIAHYRNSADYEDSVFFCGQVQPSISGLTEEWRNHLEKSGVKIGSRNALLLPVGGAFNYTQAQPNPLVREAMLDKQDLMVMLGARLVEAKSSNKTATQAENDASAQTSVLATCVSNVSEAYTQAIKFCAKYMNINDEEILFEINRKFIGTEINPQNVMTLVSAWQQGAIRKIDMVNQLQKAEIIDPEANPDEVIAELEQQTQLI